MKSLLIVGAGEYGQLVREMAYECGYGKVDFNAVVCTEANVPKETKVCSYTV